MDSSVIFGPVHDWRTGAMQNDQFLALHKSTMSNYIATVAYLEGVARIKSNRSGVKDMADLFENTRVGLIEEAGGFSSKLVLVNDGVAGIGSLPSPSVVYAAEVAVPFQVDVYRITGMTEIDDIPSISGLMKLGTMTVKQGDVFVLESGDRAYKIRNMLGGSLLHRIDTPLQSRFTYNFDSEALTFQGAAFSDHDGTRDDFFVQLVNAIVVELLEGRQATDAEIRSQIAAMVDFLKRMSMSTDVNVFSRWKAIQGLGKVDPPEAVAALEFMRASGGPNARERAAAVLKRFAA